MDDPPGSEPWKGYKLSFFKYLTNWVTSRVAPKIAPPGPAVGGREREQSEHFIILDGTLSSLDVGSETNAGLTFKLLTESGPVGRRYVYYEPGVQLEDWRHLADVAQGKGINRQIRRAYGYLCSHYRPGDRIFLLGYSRGAYAVRSLAGVIDNIGLIKRDCATERNVQLAYRHYRRDPNRAAAQAFRRRFCHPGVEVEMVGVWDTVKALGIRLPLLWMLTENSHAFHNHQLGHSIRHGFHALALNETRVAFAPVLWECPKGWEGNVEQAWFRGAHADIGGQVGRFAPARALSNIPLIWMLEKMESCGVDFPDGWRNRFPCDANAPMVGTWRGWGGVFLLRRKRKVGLDTSEHYHSSVQMDGRGWLAAAPEDAT